MKFKLAPITIFLFVILTGCSQNVDRANQAWQVTHDWVLERNKNRPDVRVPEADDPDVKIERLSDDRYRISAWGEGRNGYGVVVRHNWTCIAEYDGEEQWRIKDYTVFDANEADSLPPTVTLVSKTNEQIPAFLNQDDYLDYYSNKFEPSTPLPNGRVFNMSQLLASGNMFYLQQNQTAKPQKRILSDDWLVVINDGQHAGKTVWVRNEYVTYTK